MCRLIWEWIYAKQSEPQDTEGHFGVLGGHEKSEEAVKRLDRFAPNLVHVCGFVWEWTYAKYNVPLDIGGGGGRGHTFKVREDVKRLDRLAPHLVHMCIFIWEWIHAKQIAPRDTRGIWGVLGGQTFKSQGKLSNGSNDWHHIWYMSADSSWNRHS